MLSGRVCWFCHGQGCRSVCRRTILASENSRADKCSKRSLRPEKSGLWHFTKMPPSKKNIYERLKSTLINYFISLSRMQSVAWSSTTLLHERIHFFHGRCILNSGVRRCSPSDRKSFHRKWQRAQSSFWARSTSKSNRCIICLCWQS